MGDWSLARMRHARAHEISWRLVLLRRVYVVCDKMMCGREVSMHQPADSPTPDLMRRTLAFRRTRRRASERELSPGGTGRAAIIAIPLGAVANREPRVRRGDEYASATTQSR